MKQEKYYYIRDNIKSDPNGLGRPIITVCLIEEYGIVARGIAVCSNLDQPCKKVGRVIAKTRAMHALILERTSLAIKIKRFPHRAYTPLIAFSGQPYGGFKSHYRPALTKHERKLFRIDGNHKSDNFPF